MYTGAAPAQNDGKTAYALTVKNSSPDSSEKTPQIAYTVNNVTAKPNADGSRTIHFGGGDTTAVNYLPIMPGWNYLFRMWYRSQQAVLDNSWKVPRRSAAGNAHLLDWTKRALNFSAVVSLGRFVEDRHGADCWQT
ncbi:unnamed protein product, partial [Mesorhabditis spiculigera]